jgi:hypothetical protein
MRTQLKIEYEDYFEICRLSETLHRGKKRWSPIAIASYGACGFGFLFLVTREPYVVWLAPVMLIATGLTALVTPHVQGDRKLREAFAHYAEHVRATELQADDTSITFASPRGLQQVYWTSVSGFQETRRLFVLRSEYRDVMIPKRSFEEPAEAEAFCACARAHVLEKAQGFPVVPREGHSA